MANKEKEIDWSSLWKKEDWWACWIGWFLLLLALVALLPAVPKLARWTEFSQAFPRGGAAFWSLTKLFLVLVILTSIGAAAMKKPVKSYIPGFLVIYLIAFVALVVSNQKQIHLWGFEYVLWALFIGLFISNVLSVPGWLKPALMT
ncbi:MAG: hypothetical protein OEW45_13180, partial [Deltaproteobacteria bacterium]|nr:hypothetical protein [Deltaproteobacteria bacterium]